MNRKKCEICGRKAVYVHFGVLTCGACKVFFRRNAQKGLDKMKCHWNEKCDINENNVHVCAYCRLKKCFSLGMQVERIRASLSKRTKIQNNPPPSTISTLNLLQRDNSTLTTEQWNDISNISHCYDEYSGFRKTESYIKEQNLLPAILRFKPQSFINYCQDIFQNVEFIYLNNRDFLSLPSEDRSLLLNNTIQHVSSLSTTFLANKAGLINYPGYYDALAIISHPMMTPLVKLIEKQVGFDMIIMKLFLGIYCFSTVNYTCYMNSPPVNLTNLKQVLDIQNKYIELAWKYLLYKIGFKEAVKAFVYILRYLFSINESIEQLKSVQWFTNTMDSIAEQTEIIFITEE